jgi:hypothetical protein
LRELTIRTSGPSLVVVVELEGPVRLLLASHDADDLERLSEWVGASPARAAAILSAIAAADVDGHDRAARWHGSVGDSGRPSR